MSTQFLAQVQEIEIENRDEMTPDNRHDLPGLVFFDSLSFEMGNTLSSGDGEENSSRTPFRSIENEIGFSIGAASPSPRSRRASFKRGRRGAATQPAGCAATAGSIGDRWPVDGVALDVHASRGRLGIHDNPVDGSIDCVVTWTLDVGVYDEMMRERRVLPRRISSSPFRVHTVGTRLLWKLTIATKDHDDDSFSLYLESVNGGIGEPFSIETRFELFIGEMSHPLREMSLAHIFSEGASVWGIQNVIRLEDAMKYLEEQEQQLTIHLRFSGVRDALLFPRQFVKLSAENPELYKICDSPKIFMMEHFLTMDECESLIRAATPHLYRSRVSSGTETASRTSSSMFFTGRLSRVPVVQSVKQKLERLIACPEVHEGRCLEMSESLQAVHYNEGEFYAEHYDVRAGQAHLRAATLIVYLCDTDSGGATYFPRASRVLPNAESLLGASAKTRGDRTGLRIYPRLGRAILFWSRLPKGREDRASLHAAEPVIHGEKWIATRWLREIDEGDP